MNTDSFKILFFLLTVTLTSAAQENAPVSSAHSIGFDIGNNRIKEELVIPKVHNGMINSISYRFEKNKKSFYSVQFAIGYGKLKTDLETEKVTQNGQISVDYSKGYRIGSNEKINYFLGYNIKYSWSIMEFPVWDESRAYWNTSLSAGPFNRLVIPLNNSKMWITSWDLSILGIESRPDAIRLYAQEDWSLSGILNTTNSGFKFGFLNNILISNFRTEYRIPLKKERHFSLFFSLIYTKISNKNEPLLFNIRNRLGAEFGF